MNSKNINIYAFILSSILILVGFFYFEPRSFDSLSPINNLGIDETNYLKLSLGINDVAKTHLCRFFLPLLVKLLPFDAINGIFYINLISFFFLYFGLIKILDKFLISRANIFFTLLVFNFSFSVAYNFNNPYLTDLPAMATIIFYIYSMIKSRFVASLFWISISLLFRETAIVLWPLFFIRFSIIQSVLATFVILIIYFLPKLIIVGSFDCGPDHSFTFYTMLNYEFIAKSFLSYGSLWFIGLFGLFFYNRKNKLVIFFICLSFLSLSGSLLSSIKSITDVTRMYFLSYPILALGMAFYLQNINNKKNLILILTCLIVSTIFFSTGLVPNILINGSFDNFKHFARSNLELIIISSLFQLFFVLIFCLKNTLSIKKKI